jgi:hypothetical protein
MIERWRTLNARRRILAAFWTINATLLAAVIAFAVR